MPSPLNLVAQNHVRHVELGLGVAMEDNFREKRELLEAKGWYVDASQSPGTWAHPMAMDEHGVPIGFSFVGAWYIHRLTGNIPRNV